MITNNAREISEFIQKVISDWHTENADRSEDYVVVTEEMKAIRPLNVHRNDIEDVLHDLVITNTEMWHVQDKRLSSDNDDVIARATRDSNTLNQRRNDFIEEIDEIYVEKAENQKEEN